MDLLALKTFWHNGGVLSEGEPFTTTDAHGRELIKKGYACGPATGSAFPADPAPPPDVARDGVPEATPDQPESPTPPPKGGTSAGKRPRKSKT